MLSHDNLASNSMKSAPVGPCSRTSNITHPGGGATDPLSANSGKVLKDAAVFGLRTVLKF